MLASLFPGDEEPGKQEMELESVNWLLLKFLGCERPQLAVLILDPRPGCSQDKGVCITLSICLRMGFSILIYKVKVLEEISDPSLPSSESRSSAPQCHHPMKTIEQDDFYKSFQKRIELACGSLVRNCSSSSTLYTRQALLVALADN